jgi:hypothetical protein
MVGKITPVYIPKPAGMLGWDGTDFHAVRTDTKGRVQVRGEDQLVSYTESLYDESYGQVSGAGGYRESLAVPANTVWHVTALSASDDTRATTQHAYAVYIGAHYYKVANPLATYVTGQMSYLLTDLWLEAGATIRVIYIGSLALDACGLWVHGHTLKKEV